MVILNIINHIKHLNGNFFFPTLQLDFNVPVKFCKQNIQQRQGWLIPVVLSLSFICTDPRQMILPDRFKTNSLQFPVAISLSLNFISIRFRFAEFCPSTQTYSPFHVSALQPFLDSPCNYRAEDPPCAEGRAEWERKEAAPSAQDRSPAARRAGPAGPRPEALSGFHFLSNVFIPRDGDPYQIHF